MHYRKAIRTLSAAVMLAVTLSTAGMPVLAADAEVQETAEGAGTGEQGAEEEKQEEVPEEETAEGDQGEEGSGKEEDPSGHTSIADALHEEQKTVPDNTVYLIRIGYEFEDGSVDEWARGTALLAGDKYLLTRQSLADTSTESSLYKRIVKERGDSYQRIGVYLSNASDTEKSIVVQVMDGKGKKQAVSDIRIKNGMALLTLKEEPEAVPCIFADKADTESMIGTEVGAKAAGSAADKSDVHTYTASIVKAPEGKEGLYVQADLGEASAVGTVLYNEKGNVIGMIAGEGDSKPCFTLSAIRTFLSTSGVRFRTASRIEEETAQIEEDDVTQSIEDSEQQVPKKDTSSLEGFIASAQEIDPSQYTEESYRVLSDALAAAKKTLENEDSTQAEINTARKNLEEAMQGLEAKKSPVNAKLIIRVVGITVLLALLAVTLRTLIKKKPSMPDKNRKPKKDRKEKKQKKDKQPEEQPVQAEEPEEDYDDTFFDYDDELDITKRTRSRKDRVSSDNRPEDLTYADEEDESRVTDLDKYGREGTKLLSKKAYFIRRDNGRRIPITRDDFTIGKEVGKVNYVISGNSTVSRVHARVRNIKGDYYIEDLESTNYTFVNGKQIPSHNSVKLENGTTVRLSDVEMEFREEG